MSLLERLKGGTGTTAPAVVGQKASPAAPASGGGSTAPAVPGAETGGGQTSPAAPGAGSSGGGVPAQPRAAGADSPAAAGIKRMGPLAAPKPAAVPTPAGSAAAATARPLAPTGGVAGRLLSKQQDGKKDVGGGPRSRRQAQEAIEDPYRELKDEVQRRLVEQLDQESLKAVSNDQDRRDIVRGAIEKIVVSVSTEKQQPFTRQIQKKLVDEIVDDVLGLGPLEPLLQDDAVREIMVNGPYQIYVVQGGKMVPSGQKFRDNNHVLHVIDRIVAPLGRRVDESSPMVDARLKDGSRVNAVVPPLALCGPTLTIRKFSKDPLTMQNLIDFGTLTSAMADFLAACVRIRLNIFVSGGAGSGKTTTLNILSAFIPEDERIITIEDAAELQLAQEHVVSLETRPANIEGKGEVSMRDLVKNCLRMRPERIIVGEVRSSEALDMLQAMNTGHDGSMATGHSNSPKDMVTRIETMVMMAGMDMPSKAIREQVSSAVDLIVQQNRMRDGTRKLVNITEIQGMEGDEVIIADIFKFEQTGVAADGKIIGEYKATGIKPKFFGKFFQEGIILPDSLFEPQG